MRVALSVYSNNLSVTANAKQQDTSFKKISKNKNTILDFEPRRYD